MKSNATVRLPGARVARQERNKIKQHAAALGISVEELIRRSLRYYMRDRRASAQADAPLTLTEWEQTYWLMRCVRDPQNRQKLEEITRLLARSEG